MCRHLPYTVGFKFRKGRGKNGQPYNLKSEFDATAPVPNLVETLGQQSSVLATPPKTPPPGPAQDNGEVFFEPHSNNAIAEECQMHPEFLATMFTSKGNAAPRVSTHLS